jgi:hypothetical protein
MSRVQHAIRTLFINTLPCGTAASLHLVNSRPPLVRRTAEIAALAQRGAEAAFLVRLLTAHHLGRLAARLPPDTQQVRGGSRVQGSQGISPAAGRLQIQSLQLSAAPQAGMQTAGHDRAPRWRSCRTLGRRPDCDQLSNVHVRRCCGG